MHDHRVALLDHPLEQLPHPSVAHSHLLGGLPLADASFLGSSQPVQLVPFLLAHRDSFHPLALRLSRGTFYFGQLGTSHFGATILAGSVGSKLVIGYGQLEGDRCPSIGWSSAPARTLYPGVLKTGKCPAGVHP